MGKKIIIGITGSIAAFKTVQFISNLMKKDYIIDVVMTEAATKFVTPTSISALTKRKVYVDVFDDDPGTITHIDLVKDADAYLIMPASATTIAKITYGLADNMLTASFLAATCPKIIVPAMNVHMYQNAVTQRNIAQLKADGVAIVEPVVGQLACGDIGEGKLADYETIELMLKYCMSEHPLKGQRVLVSAGPTQEALDPVRFISNHSSGKMGYSIAKAAFVLGADVTLISGPVSLPQVPYVRTVNITSAGDLYDAIRRYAPLHDYIIMAAAVADYRPVTFSDSKIKKSDDDLTLPLTRTTDILAYLGTHRREDQVVCGFAMETDHLIDNAKGKLLKKKCDLIIANSLTVEGAGFATDTNVISFIEYAGVTSIEKKSKDDLGFIILEKCRQIKEKKDAARY